MCNRIVCTLCKPSRIISIALVRLLRIIAQEYYETTFVQWCNTKLHLSYTRGNIQYNKQTTVSVVYVTVQCGDYVNLIDDQCCTISMIISQDGVSSARSDRKNTIFLIRLGIILCFLSIYSWLSLGCVSSPHPRILLPCTVPPSGHITHTPSSLPTACILYSCI